MLGGSIASEGSVRGFWISCWWCKRLYGPGESIKKTRHIVPMPIPPSGLTVRAFSHSRREPRYDAMRRKLEPGKRSHESGLESTHAEFLPVRRVSSRPLLNWRSTNVPRSRAREIDNIILDTNKHGALGEERDNPARCQGAHRKPCHRPWWSFHIRRFLL